MLAPMIPQMELSYLATNHAVALFWMTTGYVLFFVYRIFLKILHNTRHIIFGMDVFALYDNKFEFDNYYVLGIRLLSV